MVEVKAKAGIFLVGGFMLLARLRGPPVGTNRGRTAFPKQTFHGLPGRSGWLRRLRGSANRGRCGSCKRSGSWCGSPRHRSRNSGWRCNRQRPGSCSGRCIRRRRRHGCRSGHRGAFAIRTAATVQHCLLTMHVCERQSGARVYPCSASATATTAGLTPWCVKRARADPISETLTAAGVERAGGPN
jgi:hypothetical protein